MCDEIDSLRAEVGDMRAVLAISNELTRELTKHADAMRRAISDWIDLTPGDDNHHVYWNATDAARAYDDFIAEA